MGIFSKISFNLVQVFFGTCDEKSNNKKLGVTASDFLIFNHFPSWSFHVFLRKMYGKWQKMALKRSFLEKFSTDFFLSKDN